MWPGERLPSRLSCISSSSEACSSEKSSRLSLSRPKSSSGTGWSSHPGGSSTASWSAATRLAGEGDGERLAGAAAAVERLPNTVLPEAEGACSPSGGIPPDGAGAAFPASVRSQNARRLLALASVKLAQMSQAGSSPLRAASAWALPRQATQRRWRSPLSLACPQSG